MSPIHADRTSPAAWKTSVFEAFLNLDDRFVNRPLIIDGDWHHVIVWCMGIEHPDRERLVVSLDQDIDGG
jgi:hypothetical protein